MQMLIVFCKFYRNLKFGKMSLASQDRNIWNHYKRGLNNPTCLMYDHRINVIGQEFIKGLNHASKSVSFISYFVKQMFATYKCCRNKHYSIILYILFIICIHVLIVCVTNFNFSIRYR